METNINTQSIPTKAETPQSNVAMQALAKQEQEKQTQNPLPKNAENLENQAQKAEKIDNEPAQKSVSGVFLTTADAEEYRLYKKQKILSAVALAVSRTQGSLLNGEDVQRVCERANRLRQSAVKVPLSKLMQAKYYLGASSVKLDCVIGGTGETLTKVKVYEARLAVKRKAQEITLILSPSVLDTCRYGELRKEIKRVKRAIRRAVLKVQIPKLIASSALTRVARICCETGARFLSVPYFSGCERLRLDLTGGCELEVLGVENFADYRRLIGAGVRRIVTEHAWEFYSEWLKECGERSFLNGGQGRVGIQQKENSACEPSNTGVKREEKAQESEKTPVSAQTGNPETDYKCRLEGTQLKFL